MTELEAYKHIVQIAEELLNYAGLPDDLMEKYQLMKRLTLDRVGKVSEKRASSDAELCLQICLDVFRGNLDVYLQTLQGLTRAVQMKRRFDVEQQQPRSLKETLEASKLRVEIRQVIEVDEITSSLFVLADNFKAEVNECLGLLSEAQSRVTESENHNTQLMIELELAKSKANQAIQYQSLELIERNQFLKEENERLKENLMVVSEKMKFLEEKTRRELERPQMNILQEERIRNLELKLKRQESFINTFVEEIAPFYDKYYRGRSSNGKESSGTRGSVKDEGLFDKLNFMIYLLQKFENDNTWLLEKVTELKRETEETSPMKSAHPSSVAALREVLEKIEKTKSVLNDFESSRDRLLKYIETERKKY